MSTSHWTTSITTSIQNHISNHQWEKLVLILKRRWRLLVLLLVIFGVFSFLFNLSLSHQAQSSASLSQQSSSIQSSQQTLVEPKQARVPLSDGTAPATQRQPQTANIVNATLDPLQQQAGDITSPTEREQEEASFSVLVLVCILTACLFITFVYKTFKITALPECIIFIGVGFICGFLLWLKSVHINAVLAGLEPKTFFLVFVPILMFESGYSLQKAEFFQNIGQIGVFAVIGTVISAIVMGAGLSILLPWREAFMFASVLSAVDPIATIAAFSSVQVDAALSIVVVGESVLNDAVAITLYRSLEHGTSFFNTIGNFMWVSFGSIFIGLLFAILAALLFKHSSLHKQPTLEGLIMLILTYAPYVAAETLGVSGILAILVNAIASAHYTLWNLSPFSQISIQQVIRAAAFVCEACIFVYLGMALWTFNHSWHFGLILLTLLLCFLSRAASVFPLSWLLNLARFKIGRTQQIIMWFSGLRGAIAFTLALGMPLSPYHNSIVTTTLVVVLFTTVFLGGGTSPLLRYLLSRERQSQQQGDYVLPVEQEPQQAAPSTSTGSSLFVWIDDRYFKRFFRIRNHRDFDTIQSAIEQFKITAEDALQVQRAGAAARQGDDDQVGMGWGGSGGDGGGGERLQQQEELQHQADGQNLEDGSSQTIRSLDSDTFSADSSRPLVQESLSQESK